MLSATITGASVFLFFGCDKLSVVDYTIENNCGSDISLTLFDYQGTDSVMVLAHGEDVVLFYEEYLGRVRESRIDTLVFLDALTITRVEDNVRSTHDFMPLDVWNFKETGDYHGEYRLVITEDHF